MGFIEARLINKCIFFSGKCLCCHLPRSQPSAQNSPNSVRRSDVPRISQVCFLSQSGESIPTGTLSEGEDIYFGRTCGRESFIYFLSKLREKSTKSKSLICFGSLVRVWVVCTQACVSLSEFFISVNLCNYIPTEGGIKPGFICWDDEYDSALLYRLHICRQTHINLHPWWCCSEGCVIKHCYMRKWINL